MQITIDVEKITDLFLKQEMGTGSIGDDEVSFGICLPTGAPYVHARGEYFSVPDIFEKLIRATTPEQESHEGHPAPCDEHVAQPASTPEDVAEIVARRDHGGADCAGRDEAKASDFGAAYGSLHGQHAGRTPACPDGVDICAGRICTHEPDAEGPDDQRPDES